MLELLVTAWVLSPFVLFILYHRANQKRKQLEETLKQLYLQGRISPDELFLAGLPHAEQEKLLPPTQSCTPPPMVAATSMDVPSPSDGTLPVVTDQSAVAEQPPISEQTVADSIHVPADVPAVMEPPVASTQEIPDEKKQTVEGTFISQKPVLPERFAEKQKNPVISAITVMLSVGVFLIVISGLLFVKTAWSDLSAFGRLLSLASGSILFFGVSTLSRKAWHLTRTSTAFFSLGAFFLPISVWAAGYLNLLGGALSGASNPWLYTLAFASFCIVAVCGVGIYQHPFWGGACLTGVTVTFLTMVRGFAGSFGVARNVGIFFLCATLWAALLLYLGGYTKMTMPLTFRPVIEPFSLVYTFLLTIASLLSFAADSAYLLFGIAFFVLAVCFLAPAITSRMQNGTAFPFSLLLLCGFWFVFHTFLDTRISQTLLAFDTSTYVAFVATASASVALLLCLTNVLPEVMQKGMRLASYAFVGLALCTNLLSFFRSNCNIILLFANITLLLLVAIPAWRRKNAPFAHLTAAQLWVCMVIVLALVVHFVPDLSFEAVMLIGGGIAAGCWLLLALLRRLRTLTSDLLFPLTMASLGMATLIHSNYIDMHLHVDTWVIICWLLAYALLLAPAGLYWRLALKGDGETPQHSVFACLMPLLLGMTASGLSMSCFARTVETWAAICWAAAAISLAFLLYSTTKRRFTKVRQLMFGMLVVPPVLLGLIAEMVFSRSAWETQLLQVICVLGGIALWILFARRGFKSLAITSFSCTLVLTLQATFFYLYEGVYDGERSFTVLLLTSLWICALSILAIVISNRILFFVGSKTIPLVMQFAAPVSALALAFVAADLPRSEWHTFYFVCTLGLSVLAFLTTKKEAFFMPAISAWTAITSMEALRSHAVLELGAVETETVILTLFAFVGLTILFPYLGYVLREGETRIEAQRRGWVLTFAGGVIPFWLLCAVCDMGYTNYTVEQTSWLRFFVPVLYAGYVLHFAYFTENTSRKRHIYTLSAGFGMLAFWLQPLVDVDGTYWDGKLHLLPLIAFGGLLRYLYGKRTGGNYFFGIGVYAMLRLVIDAMASETPADLLTVLAAGIIVFLVSFYIKEKKWFLLGGITLLCTAGYMQFRLTDGLAWWAYLLLAGIILIVVAGMNEMMKQQGESLKEKAGRLWDDWQW